MKKRTILILLCIGVIIITPVNASILDDFWNKINPSHKTSTPVTTQLIIPIKNDFNSFMEKLHNLNTQTNIQLLNQEMSDYGINSIKIRMYKMPWGECKECGVNFYILKDKGIVDFYPDWGTNTKDIELTLTHSQVQRMIPYIESGDIDFFDRWQLYAIYKMGR